MDKKLKTRWVKALLSGRYKQGTSYLYDEIHQEFCCLGVLCVVAGAKREAIESIGLPKSVDGFRNIIGRREANKLACLNDAGVPFDVLAGLIDQAL